MTDIETKYAGLTLKNPLIVSSSGLTKDIDGVKRADDSGAGAVVLRSVFEEEILADVAKAQSGITSHHPEEYDYLRGYDLHEYLKLIEKTKQECSIPIIASINCTSSSLWVDYAKKIQAAGADALELNISILPNKEHIAHPEFEQTKGVPQYYDKLDNFPPIKFQNSDQVEEIYYDVLKELKKHISIPIIYKIGPYFTSLINFAKTLDSHDVNALVLFNWFFTPDFDIDTKEVIHTMRLSNSQYMGNTLRWISLLNNEVKCDLSATTGVHDAKSCIKLLMAGASTIQLCSAIYKNGFSIVEEFLKITTDWMDKNNYSSIKELKGSLRKHLDKDVFTRMQYVKMYTSVE
jgi:dihydroorotate dehydrogenase (fumarate)